MFIRQGAKHPSSKLHVLLMGAEKRLYLCKRGAWEANYVKMQEMCMHCPLLPPFK